MENNNLNTYKLLKEITKRKLKIKPYFFIINKMCTTAMVKHGNSCTYMSAGGELFSTIGCFSFIFIK